MKIARARWLPPVLAVWALAGTLGVAVADPPAAVALCTDVGGTWDATSSTCATTGTNANHIKVAVSAQYPADLLDDATAGPVLKEFVRKFFTDYGHPDDAMTRDGDAQLTYQRFQHAPNTVSVLFTNFWYLGGAHPNDDITTFTFDLAAHKQLALADLFCSTDAASVNQLLDPLVKRYARSTFTRTGSNESLPDYTEYTDGYRAWVLDGDELVIQMPAGRTGPVHAGMFVARIPLSALGPNLRDGGCAA